MGRRRSRSPKGSRRDRSRDRVKDSSRYDDDRRSQSSSSRNTAGSIEALKNRMKTALNEAKSELSEASTSSGSKQQREDPISAAEAARRTREIERIDSEGGFRPAEFKSTAGGAGGRVRKDGTGTTESEKKQRAHEKAIYGPSARSAAVEVNQTASAAPEQPIERTNELAHPRLSKDPEARNKHWLEVLREQRRELLC
uniref:SMAP domain-containing protein n=1 Tax=Steinernema glaseri TaxID=37863 RepID=A0A1I7ZVL8_9BILA